MGEISGFLARPDGHRLAFRRVEGGGPAVIWFGGFQRGRGRHYPLLFAVLIDEQNARDADVFIDARAILGRRRGHGTTNRQALLVCGHDGRRNDSSPTR